MLQISRFRPAVAMVGFLLGVAIHSFWPLIKFPFWTWLIIAGILVFFCIFIRRLAYRVTRFAIVFLVCFAAGLWRFDVAVPPTASSQAGEFTAIVAEVEDGFYGKQAIVKTDDLNLQTSLKQDVPLGSKIKFTCALKPLEQKKDELDRRFAYRLHQAQAQCTPKDLIVIAKPPWWDIRQSFADLRVWTNRRIATVLPGEDGMLIAGMLYGERGMSQKSNDLFRRAGLTHLIAVSGSNITIVASIVFAVLLGFGLWRCQAFWMTTIILGAYVTFTGFSASVARAAVMGWLVLLARHVGRQPRTWHILLVSAFALCLIDPWMLAFDAGFALSFLATIGLMIWSPIIAKKLSIVPAAGGLREAAATTISATLMTTPYMAFAFERISLAGLITNLIAVPLVPWAMLFGALSAVWGPLPGANIISLPALGVARLIFWSASLADYFPWLSQETPRLDFLLLVTSYALLTWIYFKLRGKNDFSTETELFCQR
ncbi:MAG: ComEC/Rec2 family competence protein [Patescibacteria group bacterium]|nr:ComEC/Rec2 family competence protein [Patescibacteria group bacterium]